MPTPQKQASPDFIPVDPDFIPAGSAAPVAADQTSSPTLLDSINTTFANNPGEGQPGGYAEHLRPIGNIGRRAVRDVAGMAADFGHKITNPSEWGFRISPDDARPMDPDLIDQIKDYAHTARSSGIMQAGSDLAGDVLAGVGTGEAAGKLLHAPVSMKKILAGDVTAPMPGSTVSPFDRYQAAKRAGVELNAADATNSGPLKLVQRLNKESLVGSPTYERAKSSNLQNLRGFTDRTLDEMSPIDSEQGGKLLQDKLKENHQALKEGAATEFEDLQKQTGDAPVQGAESVGEAARQHLAENEPLYSQFPSLRPAKSMSVLSDLAKIGAPSEAADYVLPGDSREFAHPLPSWGDLQQIRSNVHDIYQNSPDLVQDHGNGMLKSMTHVIDRAMTGGESGLTPAQIEQFRDANEGWKAMKDTYDNNSSPFYHAVRTPNASSLVKGIGERTPEMIRAIAPRVGEQGMGVLRRGVTEDLLRNDKEGEYNLPTFARKFHALPEGYRRELFATPSGPDFNEPLQDIGTTANTLDENFNRSGSGTHGQKVAEAVAMIPTAGAPLLQYPLAKIMHNPGVVDWLMRPHAAPNPFFAPAAGAAGVATGTPHRRMSPFDQ